MIRASDEIFKENVKVDPMLRLFKSTFGMQVGTAYVFTRIVSLLLVFGVPLGLALSTWRRPTRLALCLGGVLLGNALYEYNADERTLYRDRSYFGILRVMVQESSLRPQKAGDPPRTFMRATYLMHGTTHHGLNFSCLTDPRMSSPTSRVSRRPIIIANALWVSRWKPSTGSRATRQTARTRVATSG